MRRVLVLCLVSFGLSAGAPVGAIINGTPAQGGAWPSMAAIFEDGAQICGGALVAPTFVLSAAHCFYDNKVGGVDTSKAYGVQIGGGPIGSTSSIGVQQVVLHPSYNPLTAVNDVALLRLAASSSAPAQALAAKGQATEAGTTATVIGYGATRPDGSSPSNVLLTTTVPVISDAECATEHDNIEGPRHVCAGTRGTDAAPGNDSCQGDSGGPLFVTVGGGFQQVGIVSYGGEKCGVEDRGVYAEVAGYRDWIDGILAGAPATQPDPANPDDADQGAEARPFRVASDPDVTRAIEQAAEVSFQVFEMGEAEVAVLARADLYPDALGGSALGFGSGPLLFTDGSGVLPEATEEELVRALPEAGTVYILGGPAAVPSSIDGEVAALGFTPVRLAGSDRFGTARLVADEVVRTIGEGGVPPQDTMIVATAFNWPDAVTGGQIAAWWGTPILLTQPGELNAATRAAIQQHQPENVLVLGGTTVISDAVLAEIDALVPDVLRLAGATRWGTSAAIMNFHHQALRASNAPIGPAIAVNLRRADGFAHVLSASVVAGAFAGVFVPLEGENGSTLTAEMATAACGKDLPLVIAGARDLITDAGASRTQQALIGQAC